MNNRGNKVDNSTTSHKTNTTAIIDTHTADNRVDDKKHGHAAIQADNSTATIKQNRTYRQYRRITPEVISKFKALKAIHGNGTQAVRELEPSTVDASRKAFVIASKTNTLDTNNYIDTKLQQISIEAIERLRELVASPNESIATKNVHYTLDRQGGKAIQRSEVKQVTLNIDAILG